MRLLLAVILTAFAASTIAQSTPRPRPPGTSPLEEPPPLPPASSTTKAPETIAEIESKAQVSKRVEGDQTIEEYKVNGKLFMTRVTPKHGRPYVMIDHRGDGTFTRMDSLEPGMRVPQWVIFEF
jgi:hypothetical protein